MKRLSLAIAALLLLSACKSSIPIAFTLTFRGDSSLREALITASEGVIERRVYAIEQQRPRITVSKHGEEARMTLNVNDEQTPAILSQQLALPLEFRIMREAAENEKPDIITENRGAFKDMGITESALLWVKAEMEEPGAKGKLTINFNEEGKKQMQKIFTENQGKLIGLFVRGGLVSSYKATEGGLKDSIVIAGVPSFDLAEIFADDVNVGTYVTFTPVQ
ncbi:MAG: hypothetical protein PHH13_00535 [Candidatus Peribacteraceae bacterium]|nr:hypothetical protein [Candidatus Peribacteraceae bacterium]